MNAHAATSYSLEQLSDSDLLASTRGLVGRSNQMLAALLAHLAEVDARGIHRIRSCGSLYTYCIYELRMSEDEAFRRCRAAKIARQFPIIFEQIAKGELHLTAVLMLGPHLTAENHLEVLARAKHRTKKEIARLVRLLDPMPDVPARVEPLGPAPNGPAPATWANFVGSLCGPVRELPPDQRPSEWVAGGDNSVAPATDESPLGSEEGSESAQATPPADDLTAPQRYLVQFTATQEYVDLLEEAKDLLAHAVPNRSIDEVHLRAMRALVVELKKRKYAVTEEPDAGKKPLAKKDSPRQRGRYISAKVRREVWKRDGGRCTYIDVTGQRCRETASIELHHEQAHARAGRATEENLTLRCRSHNALAAEEDFGREFMASKRGRLDDEAGSDPRQRQCGGVDPRQRGEFELQASP